MDTRIMDSLCRNAGLEGWIIHSWNGNMGFELSQAAVEAWDSMTQTA